jgi:hypothetical protein
MGFFFMSFCASATTVTRSWSRGTASVTRPISAQCLAFVEHGFDRLGDVTGRDDAPVDLRNAECRVVGGDREVARDEREETPAERPAVDHRDRRLGEVT